MVLVRELQRAEHVSVRVAPLAQRLNDLALSIRVRLEDRDLGRVLAARVLVAVVFAPRSHVRTSPWWCNQSV